METEDTTAEPAGPGPGLPADLRLTRTQKEILEALCRPRAEGNRYAPPATNQEIASAVFLSVDAVKAHLRVLYRKFGVEPLPHNQKRARLVELVFEGGVLELPTEEEQQPPPPASGDEAPPAGRRASLVAVALIVGIFVAGALVMTEVFDSSASREEATPPGEFRAELNRFCGFVIPFTPPSAALPAEERANEYYSSLAAVTSRVDDIPPPPGPQSAVDQFTAGLRSATELNDSIALGTPDGKSRERVVADLTIASGNVQAGALGFGLGSDCKAIANIIRQSAASVARG